MEKLNQSEKTEIIENIVNLKKCINIELNAIIEKICPGYFEVDETAAKPIDIIINTVCDYFNINKKRLLTPRGVKGSGVAELIRIRQIISLIAYSDYGYGYTEIGKSLIRTHATMLNAKNRAIMFCETELAFRADVDECRKSIDQKFKRDQT